MQKEGEMIGVGRAKQNLNVVDRPLGKGKSEVIFCPSLFSLLCPPDFLCYADGYHSVLY